MILASGAAMAPMPVLASFWTGRVSDGTGTAETVGNNGYSERYGGEKKMETSKYRRV